MLRLAKGQEPGPDLEGALGPSPVRREGQSAHLSVFQAKMLDLQCEDASVCT